VPKRLKGSPSKCAVCKAESQVGTGDWRERVSARHAGSDISSYGGDARIVASRDEIGRVMSELNGIETWLRAQIELQDFLVDPGPRLRLVLELPPILGRLAHIRDACALAADSYFGNEAELSRELRESPELPIKNIAAGFAGLGAALGVLTETEVSANLVAIENSIAPPDSIAGLAQRLRATAEVASGWVRIEKYREPASPVSAENGLVEPKPARYVVYIPGTQAWAPKTGANPLDLTSDLSAISKTGFAGSERAVALAMTQAGIGRDSAVLFVGHSQGGLVAANISTRYAGSKVLTFGAPIGQLGSALAAQTLSVEHKGDLIPRLDGKPNPYATNWVTVRQELPGVDPIAQHEMTGYQKTATEVDLASGDSNAGLSRIRQEIVTFAGASQGQALYFELERKP
jgi:hypothetical protein